MPIWRPIPYRRENFAWVMNIPDRRGIIDVNNNGMGERVSLNFG